MGHWKHSQIFGTALNWANAKVDDAIHGLRLLELATHRSAFKGVDVLICSVLL